MLTDQQKQDLELKFRELDIPNKITGFSSLGPAFTRINYDYPMLLNAILNIKDDYENKSSIATSYFLDLFANLIEQRILHLEMQGDASTVITRFWYTKFMLQEGANPNAFDVNGNTPMHLAAANLEFNTNQPEPEFLPGVIKEQLGIMGCLLAYGADPTIKNAKGQTPFDILQETINKADPKLVERVKDQFNLEGLKNGYLEVIRRGNISKCHQATLKLKRGDKYISVFPDYSKAEWLDNIMKWEMPEITFGNGQGKWADKVTEQKKQENGWCMIA